MQHIELGVEMKKATVAKWAVVLGVTAALSGCGSMTIADVKYLDTPEGHQVMCAGNADSGLDCDWETYREKFVK